LSTELHSDVVIGRFISKSLIHHVEHETAAKPLKNKPRPEERLPVNGT